MLGSGQNAYESFYTKLTQKLWPQSLMDSHTKHLPALFYCVDNSKVRQNQ